MKLPSSSIRSIPFHSEKEISIERRRTSLSVGRGECRQSAITIAIHLQATDAQKMAAQELTEAFSRYFSYRAGALQGELKELFRVGRRSLAIGVPILIGCLVSAHLAAGYSGDASFKRLIEESFLILGWVANWRPLEIFLYDWWPLVSGASLSAACQGKFELSRTRVQRCSRTLVDVKSQNERGRARMTKTASAPIWSRRPG